MDEQLRNFLLNVAVNNLQAYKDYDLYSNGRAHETVEAIRKFHEFIESYDRIRSANPMEAEKLARLLLVELAIKYRLIDA